LGEVAPPERRLENKRAVRKSEQKEEESLGITFVLKWSGKNRVL